MEMMVVLAAVLLTYGVSTGIAMMPSKSGAVAGATAGENGVLPLDMAVNSVDDMYDGCKDEMKKLATQYLQNEKNKDKVFKAAWDSSEKNVLQKFKEGKTQSLEKDQIVAIYYYTSAEGNVYLDFNDKVRTQGPEYKTKFGYHALHFFLTTAIQDERAFETAIQNEIAFGNKLCLTGYRRVDKYFSQDVKNKAFRFGSFTSASMRRYGNADRFGDKSCFEIYTCMGADVSLYSKFGDAEAEVLIPPYEVFKVEDIKTRSMQPGLPCEVVYKVKSTRTVSKLNCALVMK